MTKKAQAVLEKTALSPQRLESAIANRFKALKDININFPKGNTLEDAVGRSHIQFRNMHETAWGQKIPYKDSSNTLRDITHRGALQDVKNRKTEMLGKAQSDLRNTYSGIIQRF